MIQYPQPLSKENSLKMTNLNQYALRVPRILLPDESCDLNKWAVIACDQFTSEPEYWEKVEREVNGAPSALHIIYPECYLSEDVSRIAAVNRAMEDYRKDVLTKAIDGFVLVERQTTAGNRLGLVVALDLEMYDYEKGSTSLIRATEGTIEERLPPRVMIRRGAVIESPHIMVLVDDPGKTLIEPLYAGRGGLAPLYDFDLMEHGGHIRGWAVTDDGLLSQIEEAMAGLYDHCGGLLYAVGDGNHSLATAKKCWLEKRATLSASERANHPARYALVELNNLHDPANAFEPIHRAVFGADCAVLAHDFTLWLKRNGMIAVPCEEDRADLHLLGAPVRIENAMNPLPVAILQPFLDEWLTEHPEASIDYIHGEDALMTLFGKGACVFALPKIDKFSLFESVRKGGPLPRKTFSLGAARDKRYYLECRAL